MKLVAHSPRLFATILLFRSVLVRGLSSTVMPKRKQATTSAPTGILMILSPAKTLDLSPCDRLSGDWTTPECDEAKTKKIASIVKKQKAKELEKLLGISANLAKTAHEYWSSFESDPKKRSDLKPSIFSFSGAAYQGLDITSCSDESIGYMQHNLRIVDPLYGALRPLDTMQPYRLEMATKKLFPNDASIKLAAFWKPSVCDFLSTDLSPRSDKILLNLASDEYSAAVDESELPEGTQYMKVIFWEEGRTIAVHAKRARGLMVRYLAEESVETLEGVQQFHAEGYSYVAAKSDETTIVFDRKKQAAKKKAKVAAKKPAAKKTKSEDEEPAPKRSRRRT